MNTKHTFHRFSAAAALLLALAACNKSEIPGDATSPRQTPVIIEATGLYDLQPAPASRATVDGDWQGVQKVALKMGDEVKEYTVSASDADGYRSATLACTDVPFYWTSRDPITVTAWWPLDEADITRMPDVKVAEDQSTLAAFRNSDFISAEEQTVEFDAPHLTFTHRTARVTLSLKAGGGIASVEGATVSLASLSGTGDNPATVTACNTSGNTFEALVLPQTVAAGNPFIRVELGGVTFTCTLQEEVVLEAGKRYTYTVSVNGRDLTLGECTIGDWADGGGEDSTVVDSSYRYDADTHTCFVSGALGLLVWAEAAREDPTLNCTLTADITLPTVAEGESNWTLVGNFDNRYIGTFDGGGHTITGLTINLPGQQYVGLFGMIGQSGTVQHLTLAGVKITGYIVGGVAGYNGGTLTGCSVSGNVSGSDNVGGVAGVNNATVTACYATCNVSGHFDVGGVVGYNFGTVTACYHAAGDVTGDDLVGGVAGHNDSGTVTGCYWNNNRDKGIYAGSGDVTKVDGTAVTWVDAVAAMNIAIETWNDGNPNKSCDWRYDETDAATPPVLIPAN